MDELDYLKRVSNHLNELSDNFKEPDPKGWTMFREHDPEKSAILAVRLQISTVLSPAYQNHFQQTKEILGKNLSLLDYVGMQEEDWGGWGSKESYERMVHDLRLVVFLPVTKLPVLIVQEDMTELCRSLLEWRMQN